MWISSYEENMVGDPRTLTSYFRTNRAYRGKKTPMARVKDGWVPDFNMRYFTEVGVDL